MKTMMNLRRVAFILSGTMVALIPFSCGQEILRLVTPVYLDSSVSILDRIVTAVAPLVLP
jgi:hypothetical protein